MSRHKYHYFKLVLLIVFLFTDGTFLLIRHLLFKLYRQKFIFLGSECTYCGSDGTYFVPVENGIKIKKRYIFRFDTIL